MSPPSLSLGVVVATRDRRERLLATLDRLAGEGRPLAVADNGSRDGTPAAVRAAFPQVTLLELGANRGAAARTHGIRALGTDLAAFADDDSWWAPGALEHARELFAGRPSLGLIAATVLVGAGEEPDPVSEALAHSPLPPPVGTRWRSVLGFTACGAIVRSSAYLEVGGFEERMGIGGEEELLALDLVAAGHEVVHVPEIVAHHHPAGGGRSSRGAVQWRNDLWTAWLRRPRAVAARRTLGALRRGPRHPEAWRGLLQAAGQLPWALRERRVVPPRVEEAMARVEGARR